MGCFPSDMHVLEARRSQISSAIDIHLAENYLKGAQTSF